MSKNSKKQNLKNAKTKSDRKNTQINHKKWQQKINKRRQ